MYCADKLKVCYVCFYFSIVQNPTPRHHQYQRSFHQKNHRHQPLKLVCRWRSSLPHRQYQCLLMHPHPLDIPATWEAFRILYLMMSAVFWQNQDHFSQLQMISRMADSRRVTTIAASTRRGTRTRKATREHGSPTRLRKMRCCACPASCLCQNTMSL